MPRSEFPDLDVDTLATTRDALHAYAKVLGGWLKALRSRRKHWWHASLRPSLRGLSTGVVHAAADFEAELDFYDSRLRVRGVAGESTMSLSGQDAREVADWLQSALGELGVDTSDDPGDDIRSGTEFGGYEATTARALHGALSAVAANLATFRAGIAEETSPIQVWPHHFDLSMIWLPGDKIPGKDPDDEEASDKQLNFGFLFGDDTIEEPYFYVTAYPVPDELPDIDLPPGTTWRSEGFNGALLMYSDLVARSEPASYLQQLWSTMLDNGREHLADD